MSSPNKSRGGSPRGKRPGNIKKPTSPTSISNVRTSSRSSRIPVRVSVSKEIELLFVDYETPAASCSEIGGATTDISQLGSQPKTPSKKRPNDRELNAQEKFRIRVPRASTKSEHICRVCRYHEISEPRRNMPLAVINFDALKLTPEDVLFEKKPSIYNLLEELYPYFNIGVWSSLKMTEFVALLEKYSLFNADRFAIAFCLDSTSMITAFIPGLGNSQVKAMEIVWNLFPNYKNNSVMIDEQLKKTVFKHYNIDLDAKEDKLIIENEYGVFAKYLIEFFRAGQNFSKLYNPTWKLSWNQRL